MNIAAKATTPANRTDKNAPEKFPEARPPTNPPNVVTVSKAMASGQSTLLALRKTSVADKEVIMIRNRLVVAAS